MKVSIVVLFILLVHTCVVLNELNGKLPAINQVDPVMM